MKLEVLHDPKGGEANKAKFTGEQIAYALRQAELGVTVAEACRKMGISEATFCRWKQIYGGMGPSELRKMRQPALPRGLWPNGRDGFRLL